MNISARLYFCARCHEQVIICSHCDRGHRYCGEHCAQSARRQSRRRAGAKYQSSRRGRVANAARQQRYRECQRQKVTHQGSPPTNDRDLLPSKLSRHQNSDREGRFLTTTLIYCHFCQRQCDHFVRRDFLRRTSRYRQPSDPLSPYSARA